MNPNLLPEMNKALLDMGAVAIEIITPTHVAYERGSGRLDQQVDTRWVVHAWHVDSDGQISFELGSYGLTRSEAIMQCLERSQLLP